MQLNISQGTSTDISIDNAKQVAANSARTIAKKIDKSSIVLESDAKLVESYGGVVAQLADREAL